MASYNRVILIGNLTRDIELRYIPSGMAVADVGLAVNDRRKNQSGEWIEETTFVDVVVWGRTAEVMSEYLSKGSPVFIEGRLKLDTWEGQDGQKRSKMRVVCERMQLLGGRGQGGQGGPEGGAPRPAASRPAPQRAQNSNSQYSQPAPADEASFDPGPGEPSGPGDEIPF
jgi:single-strand DNA-binding protein